MATFRKRGAKWQVQIRRQGHPPISRSFIAKRDAEAWARDVELKLDRGEVDSLRQRAATPPLGELLLRYERTVTPTKRSATVERYRIRKLLRNDISHEPARSLTPERIAEYRDKRLQEVCGETVRQDLVLLGQVIETARREWGLRLSGNPVFDVRKPPPAKARQRRLTYRDLKALLKVFRSIRNPLLPEVFRFALATGMRRGEILRVEWKHIDWHHSVVTIPITKNGHPRTIPLSSAAIRVLRRRHAASKGQELVFPMTANAFRLGWQRAKAKAGLVDFRFHDLRHEAVSRFFEAGLSLPEVALISGHRDPRQLMRYTHLEAANVAKKLAGPTNRS